MLLGRCDCHCGSVSESSPPSESVSSSSEGDIEYSLADTDCTHCTDEIMPKRYTFAFPDSGGGHACQSYYDKTWIVYKGGGAANCNWFGDDKVLDLSTCVNRTTGVSTMIFTHGFTQVALNVRAYISGFTVTVASYGYSISSTRDCLATWTLTKTTTDSDGIVFPSTVSVSPG